MPYQIAGIDVHKKMLAVVVADVEVDDEYHFERQKVGTSPAELRALANWLAEREVEEVVMESTAQYWRPVWEALERYLLETEAPGATRCAPCLRHTAPCTSAIQSGRRRAKARLS
jgi:Transposase